MNIALSIKFLTGDFDPESKKLTTQTKIEKARINKPKTIRVMKNLDYIIRESNDEDFEEVKHRRRTAEEMLEGQVIDSPLGIRGITRHKTDYRWHVRVRSGVKQYHVGVFDELEDAVKARDKVYEEVKNGTFIHGSTYHKRIRQSRSERNLPPNVYKAVNNRFMAKVMHRGIFYFLGTYDTIEEALSVVKSHKEKLNAK